MKIKRIIAGAMACLMCVALVGCDKSEKTGNNGNDKITWWIANNDTSIIKSYDEIAAVKELEKKFDVDIEFVHPTAESQTEQFNIMAASGEFPDIVTYNWNGYTGGPVKAAADGAILVLDDYIEEYMPNLSKKMAEDPKIDYLARAYDGSICVLPTFTNNMVTTASFGPVIRKDWLDKLGLEIPKTIEDWYTVLKAFKTQDPNGNGKADEIPFAADGNATFTRFSRAYEGVEEHFYVDGEGKVRYGFIQPEFKEFLIEINKWYKEGLIDPEYAASNDSIINTNIVSGKSGAFIGYSGSAMTKYLLAGRELDTDFELVGTPWPTHNGGAPYSGYSYQAEPGVVGKGHAIAKTNKNVEKTLEILDYLYSDEGVELFNWGIEGESYVKDGDKKQFTDKVLKNPENKTPLEVITKYSLVQTPVAIMDADAFMQLNTEIQEQKAAMEEWHKADVSRILPTLSVSPEEQTEITKVLDDVLIYRIEWLNKFVMGIEPIDKWDGIVADIQKLGIDRATAVYQNAYDRYAKK